LRSSVNFGGIIAPKINFFANNGKAWKTGAALEHVKEEHGNDSLVAKKGLRFEKII